MDQPLTWDERLNIEVDLQADVIRAHTRGPIVARPTCARWDIEEASLSIHGNKVTSNMKAQLISQIHDGNLCIFIMEKEAFSIHTFDSIDGHAGELALKRPSKNWQMNVFKLCHNYWNTDLLW
jgi:hypothetical protein